jgi:trehalose 6-phosphate phosphatase
VTSALLSEAVAPLRLDPPKTAILLDIDGTLAPIVEQAAEAGVPEGTRQLLSRAATRYGVVACVTGRRASDARAIVGLGTLWYLGSHGSELLEAGWTEPVMDPELAGWVRRIHDFAAGLDDAELRGLRVRLEDKQVILALHWRGAPDEEAAMAVVYAVAERARAAGLHTQWGRKVLEVRPPVQIDKGTGVRRLLDELELDAAVYVGDDATDLDAFRALRELVDSGRLSRALTVGVASDEGPPEITSEADIVVDGTQGVLELLTLLVES